MSCAYRHCIKGVQGAIKDGFRRHKRSNCSSKNLSSIDASFNVTVEDITEGRIVGTATGIEGAGRGGTSVKISYIPTTTGEHILKATATVTNPDSADPNMIDNILTDTTFVVISGGGGGGWRVL